MDSPILVSGPLVKPVLSGEKTITSRLAGLEWINKGPEFWRQETVEDWKASGVTMLRNQISKREDVVKCPYGGVGSTLWVRENWYVSKGYDGRKPRELETGGHILCGYVADGEKPGWGGKTRPSIHMPRHLSRINLVITDLELTRLTQLSEEDARKEGCGRALHDEQLDGSWPLTEEQKAIGTYYFGFKRTWIEINGRPIWDLNPWVWRVHFKLQTSTSV